MTDLHTTAPIASDPVPLPVPLPVPTEPHPARAVALVTGANKGLGRETVRRLAGLGWTVWLAARDADAGRTAARELTDAHPAADIRPVVLDVTDQASVEAAAATVSAAGTGLDVLVNNAGIASMPTGATEDTAATDFAPTYDVNVLGPVRTTRAFLPLLRASGTPRVVMVSSGLGSMTLCDDPARVESHVPGMVYQSSKAALFMVADRYAAALPDVRVVSCDPGYTATDLNGHQGPQTVAEGTDAVVIGCIAEEVPAARFDRYGPIPA